MHRGMVALTAGLLAFFLSCAGVPGSDDATAALHISVAYPSGYKQAAGFPHGYSVEVDGEVVEEGSLLPPGEGPTAVAIPTRGTATVTVTTAYCDELHPDLCHFATLEHELDLGSGFVLVELAVNRPD